METICKWATAGVLLLVFVGLVSLAGCVDIVEYLGSMIIAGLAARLFYLGICRSHPDHLARPG